MSDYLNKKIPPKLHRDLDDILEFYVLEEVLRDRLRARITAEGLTASLESEIARNMQSGEIKFGFYKRLKQLVLDSQCDPAGVAINSEIEVARLRKLVDGE